MPAVSKAPKQSRIQEHSWRIVAKLKCSKQDLGGTVTKIETWCRQKLLHLGISVKIYPSSCDLYMQCQIMCEVDCAFALHAIDVT